MPTFRGISLAVALFAVAAVAPATAPAATLYTNHYSDKQIAALSIGSDGLLSSLAGSPFAVPDFLGGLAIAPDGQRMIAPFYFNGQLGVYALAADGTPSQSGPLIPADVTAAPAISPDGRFAYLGDGDGSGVRAFAIGPDGSLSQVGDGFGSNDGDGPALTPDGRFLLMPSYTDGTVERFSVQADGSLAGLGSTPVFPGGKAIRVTPDGRFAIVLSDPEGVGAIHSLAVGADGSLTPASAVETSDILSGRAPVLSPNGSFFYNANRNEDSISAYSIGADGALTEIAPPVPAGLEGPDGLAMSPDGRFLYVVETLGRAVQAFAVGADGTLAKIGGPVPTGGESDGVGPVTRPAVPIARLAAFAAAPGSPSAFDATASTDAGASLTSYAWDFGDGTTLTSSDPKPSHAYAKAGVYEVTLTVGDDAGCAGFVYTGQTAFCNAKGAQRTVKVDTPPAITGLKVVRKRFGKGKAKAGASAQKRRKKPPKAIAFRYTLSEKARLTFTIQRPSMGRIGPARCVRRKAGIKCVPSPKKGVFRTTGSPGVNLDRLPKRLRLGLGAFTATAVAVDSARSNSAPATVAFTVKKPRRPR